MDVYKCEGPNCVYTCLDSHQIHKHHIIPKSNGGLNGHMNLVRLCPNCHNRIYIPEAKHGIHSIKAKNYIQLLGIHASSGGHVLEYQLEYESKIITGYTLCDTWRNSNIDRIIKDESKK